MSELALPGATRPPDSPPRASDTSIEAVLDEILREFSEGATTPDELPELQAFVEELELGVPLGTLDASFRALSHAGYLRGAVVALADHLARRPRLELARRLASELLDALAPTLGIELAQAVFTKSTYADEFKRAYFTRSKSTDTPDAA